MLAHGLDLAVAALVILIVVQLASARDPFTCRADGRRLSDDELARTSLAFLRGEQPDAEIQPAPLPEGYALGDADAVLADPGFSVEVTREGDGPDDVLTPRRTWFGRQIHGARLAVGLTLPAPAPDAPQLRALLVTTPCGTVLREAARAPAAG